MSNPIIDAISVAASEGRIYRVSTDKIHAPTAIVITFADEAGEESDKQKSVPLEFADHDAFMKCWKAASAIRKVKWENDLPS